MAAATGAPRFLPDELVAEVLLRLPSKSLARFRCVCRSWNNLVSSDAFQRLYYQYQQQAVVGSNGRQLQLKFAAARLAPPHRWEFDGFSVVPCEDCPRFIGAKPCHRGVALLGRQCVGVFTVCNLSTGGFLHLPPCRTSGFPYVTGIGYHSAAHEYKVVQLASMTNRPIWESLDCQVLTVGDSRGWRPPSGQLDSALPNILIENMMDPVFANGCLHWTLVTVLLLRDKPEGILSFSLADESFATVPLPPFVTDDLVPYDTNHPYIDSVRSDACTPDYRLVSQPIGTALAELDGCLCMIRDLRCRHNAASMFEVWKLKDYESGVWSLDYRINLAGSMANKLMRTWLVLPICYLPLHSDSSQENRKIVLATTAHDVHIYDPQTCTLETIASVVHDGNYSRSQDNPLYLLWYQESLVHMAGMEYISSHVYACMLC
ncbi:putative F-box protein At1g32420 [Phragmites australis]|uniref:putative F-box protein At1g32420 n=1 Tax=Phragmites australis TaxID=29695 RepID=UPI002D79C239|nr:putative F-box protein At1g32420 [Phragmites australis]